MEHLKYPYPSKADKKQLENETNLTQDQISCWFLHQRARKKNKKEDNPEKLSKTVRHELFQLFREKNFIFNRIEQQDLANKYNVKCKTISKLLSTIKFRENSKIKMDLKC